MNPAVTPKVPPWYRQVWPWLLMSMPATALVGGAITLWFALSTNNSLVVDDYYREGKAINLELARDREASQLGLQAELQRLADGSASLTLTRASKGNLPPFVTVLLVHATRSELDRKLTLATTGNNGNLAHYTAQQAELPTSGRWNIVLEDPDRHWRLVATTSDPGKPVRFDHDHNQK